MARWLQMIIFAVPLFAAEAPLRILFLGNSYTYYNNLPGLVAGMAQGRAVETQAVTRGGSTLEGLFLYTDALTVLRASRWDIVVLQEQSTLGLNQFNGDMVVNDPSGFFAWARIWDAEIRAQGARTAFYSPWARQGRPEQQAHIDWAYASIAKELGAVLLPVGSAFQRVQGVPLYAPDGSHPSAAGSYLAACVAVHVLLGDGCQGAGNAIRGLPMDNASAHLGAESGVIVSLAEETAALLQAAALETAATLKAEGGYWLLSRPGPVSEAARPLPAEMEWAGRWEGATWLYGNRTNVTLQLAVQGATCSGSWQLFSLDPPTQALLPLQRCTIGPDGLQFTVKTLFLTTETHEAWPDAAGLKGRVTVQSPSPYHRQAGTWTLQRGKP